MSARTPEEVHHRWTAAMNAGDLEAVMATYEPAAAAVPGPGQVVAGEAAIRELIRGFLALQPQVELAVQQVVQAGELALLLSTWTLAGTGPDGAAVRLGGTTADVVRRQEDGSWRTVLETPSGARRSRPAREGRGAGTAGSKQLTGEATSTQGKPKEADTPPALRRACPSRGRCW